MKISWIFKVICLVVASSFDFHFIDGFLISKSERKYRDQILAQN